MSENKKLYLKSSIFGAGLGMGFGIILGTVTGELTGALTVRIAGHTGGVSIGAYSGALFGGTMGIFIPDSFRASVTAFHVLVLDVLTQGKFVTAVLLSFLLSCTATLVGAWVSGRNLKPRDFGKTS
jgi:hypothetical protein